MEAREAARQEHNHWLAAERQSRRAHRVRHALNNHRHHANDDILQAETVISTGARPLFAEDEDEDSVPSHASQLDDDRLFDEEIVAYRSLSMPSDASGGGGRVNAEAFLSPEASERDDDESESDALWLAECHPPLLRRQRAFNCGRVDGLSAFVFA